jgi:uncharacterized membrane protein
MPIRPNSGAPQTDQRMDEIICALLRYGVMLSASVVAAGGIWYLIQYGSSQPGYHVFTLIVLAVLRFSLTGRMSG